MNCIQCGTYNPDNAAFCGRCGRQLKQASSAPSFVPSQGALTGRSTQFPIGESIPTVQEVSTFHDLPFAGSFPQNQGTLPSRTQQPIYRAPSKPLSIWVFIGSIVLVVFVLIVLQLTGSDWAAGAMRMGVGAGILAMVLLLITVIRLIPRMIAKPDQIRLFQLVSAGLVILLLSLLCLVGLTQQSAIHSLQAHTWEGQQRWQSAINQYQVAGEGAPTSENIARVYNLWGEQFTSQQRYMDALTKYNIVLNYYGSASIGIARAQSDAVTTYLTWGQQASQQHDYTAATNHYDTLLNLPYCTASCKSQATALDATAYYNLGESQLTAKNYSDAINNFHTVVLRFASSPEAHKVHGDYAKALYGQGKQQLSTTLCSSAVLTYQQLSRQFGDTPEGQQAASALKSPQPVIGHFISSVPNNAPVAVLIQGLNHTMSDSQFFQLLNSAPTALIQSNGNFSFQPLPQGTYGLAWGTNGGNGAKHFQFAYNADGSSYYVAKVGPLCPYNFGDLNEAIPTA